MSQKRRHSEVGNFDDDGEALFQSPLFKEVKQNEGNVGLKIDLKAEGGELMQGEDDESKSRDDREIAANMKRLRERFYEFHRKYIAQQDPKPYFNEMKKDLLLKIDQVLESESISDYYEKILERAAATAKPGRRTWSEDEILVLVSIVTYLCKAEEIDFCSLSDANWDSIANFFPGRKTGQLKLQWLSFLKTKLTQTPWTPFEDEMLKQIMQEKGRGNHWKEIAAELNARCNSQVYRHGKQCRERWINHLDPAINRGPWTDEEDLKLLRYFLSVGGKKWADISKLMKDRTENSVKNRWNSLYKKFTHEIGYDSQSALPTDSESDSGMERERRVTQRIIDYITKNMSVNSNTSSILDKKEEFSDISGSYDHRFQDMNKPLEAPLQRKGRSYSTELNQNSEGQILNKMSLLKELAHEDSLRTTNYRSMMNFFDDSTNLQQNLGRIPTNKLGKGPFRENQAFPMPQRNVGFNPIGGHEQEPSLFHNFQDFNFESFGIGNNLFNPNRPGFPTFTRGDEFMKDEFAKPASIPRKNLNLPLKHLSNSLGIIKETAYEDTTDQMPPGIQENMNLNLKEKSFKEFHDQANKIIGANNLQFAVVDLTRGELYFVNPLSEKNLQKSLNAMHCSEAEASFWPSSPLLNFPSSQQNPNPINPNCTGVLNKDFANMKISSRRKPVDPIQIPIPLHQKDSVKLLMDPNPARRYSANIEGRSNLSASNQHNEFSSAQLFPNS